MIHGCISTLVASSKERPLMDKMMEKKGSSREHQINRMFQMNLLIARIFNIKYLNVYKYI